MVRPPLRAVICAFAPAAALAAAVAGTPAQAQIITGPARVVDGDTIDMTGTRVRLLGIDAPESAQSCVRDGEVWACGAEATENLAAIIADAPLTCAAQGTDVYGRVLAICETAVFDVGREMVRRGMALAAGNAPDGYAQADAIARRLKSGLWNAEFQTPAEWRAANPDAFKPAPAPRIERALATSAAQERRYADTYGCTIKGNHSRYGDLIYHLPGQKYYRQTRPEALFCTESEAQAAGYRRSKE